LTFDALLRRRCCRVLDQVSDLARPSHVLWQRTVFVCIIATILRRQQVGDAVHDVAGGGEQRFLIELARIVGQFERLPDVDTHLWPAQPAQAERREKGFSVPVMPTGKMAAPLRRAITVTPGLARCSRWVVSPRPRVPSGKKPRTWSRANRSRALRSAWRSTTPRRTGNAPHKPTNPPITGMFSPSTFIKKYRCRGIAIARKMPSRKLMWLAATMRGPLSGMFSAPVTSHWVSTFSSRRRMGLMRL